MQKDDLVYDIAFAHRACECSDPENAAAWLKPAPGRLRTSAVFRLAGMALAAGACSLAAPAATAAAGLVPHTAAYSMQVSPAGSNSGILGGRGVLQLEWRRDCDGMTYSQQSTLTLNSDQGAVFDSAVRIESWEAADASTFRFMLENSIDGEVTEEVSGLARRQDDGGVEVRYKRPAEKRQMMPAATVFPWQQMRAVLDGATTGVRYKWFRLLRGEAEGDPVGVAVHIVGEEGPPADGEGLKLPAEPGDLLPSQGWRIVSGYFEDSVQAEPKLEIAETVLASGVITRATITYPEMSMHLKLQRLQRVPAPECGK